MRIVLTLLVSFLFLESANAINEELMADARRIVHVKAKENFKKYEDENRDKPGKIQNVAEQIIAFFEESNIAVVNVFIVFYLEHGTEPIFEDFHYSFEGVKEILVEKDITVEKLFQNSQSEFLNEKEENESIYL